MSLLGDYYSFENLRFFSPSYGILRDNLCSFFSPDLRMFAIILILKCINLLNKPKNIQKLCFILI